MHVYFESQDHENNLYPGTHAGLAVIGDEDGTHLAFIVCGQLIAEISVPPGVVWQIWDALGNAAGDTGRSGEYDTDNWQAEVTAGRLAAPLPEPVQAALPQPASPPVAIPPPPGPVAQPAGGHVVHHASANPYGPYEQPPGARVLMGRPVSPGQPDGYTRPLPVITPGRGQACTGGSRIRRPA